MLKGAIARRYAGAIFELARKQDTLDRTLEEVQGISTVFAGRTLAYLLREPKVPAKRKEAALRQALTSQVLPTSLNLALLIVQRGLVEFMPNIANELEQLVLAYRNEVVAEVTTATPMDDAQHQLMKRTLEEQTHKTIKMHTRVDQRILGGVVARVGDRVIDGSVRSRLHALQQQLLTDVAHTATDSLFDEAIQDKGNTNHSISDAHAATTGTDAYNAVPDVKPSAYRL